MDEGAEKNLSLGLSGFRISGVRENRVPATKIPKLRNVKHLFIQIAVTADGHVRRGHRPI
jgi:hypothetical protein